MIGTYAPWLPVSSLQTKAVSRDPAVVAAYEKDPLNHHGPILARTGAQINSAVLAARDACDKIMLPAYVFHGDADGAVPVKGSREMVEALKKAGASPKYTEYPKVGHNSWSPAFAEKEFWNWVFAQKRQKK